VGEALILLATNFLWGAYHAVQPGHGKTIAAAYIVGARGRPVDAWILGIFVTLSHTSGIVVVGLLASLGLPGLESRRIEVWLKVLTGVLIIAIGLWTLWTQRGLLRVTQARDRVNDHNADPDHVHHRDHGHVHDPDHGYGPDDLRPHRHPGIASHQHVGRHRHGFGMVHGHDLDGVMDRRPSLPVLIGLGIAGGLVPDPLALSLLLRALTDGQVIVGLIGVFAFSVGFAAVLVVVGVVAAAVGKRLLQWLAGPQAVLLQIGMSVLIVLVGVILTIGAVGEMVQVQSGRKTG
jgi:nickel/cobalt exporter